MKAPVSDHAMDNNTGKPSRKRILLAVAGLSPQVVTESVYALAVEQQPAWMPTEIRLLTTRTGEERARLSLFSEEPGWFRRLCEDYRLPPIRFGSDRIHVFHNGRGERLDDIRTPEDNTQVADQVTALMRELTADHDTELHVSIAGGRKTMGYYLGYALSLFGRPQDRLSHVLVSEPFESSWNFFYPTPYSQVIETRDGALADTRDARVTLAEIPFISLRNGLPQRLLRGDTSFSDTVLAARKALEPPALIIDTAAGRLFAAGEEVTMKPAELAFYAMMARCRLNGLQPQNHRSEGLAERFLREYRVIVGEHSSACERAEAALASEDFKEWFEQRKSKTNRVLNLALGNRLGKPYLITPHGKRPHTCYVIDLPRQAIRFLPGKLADNERDGTIRDH